MHTAKLARGCGGALVLLGGAVILGWLAQLPALVRLVPGTDGMPYSTAIGFVLAGLGLLCVVGQYLPGTKDSGSLLTRQVPWSQGLALLLVILGAMALIEWQFGISLGLSPAPQQVQHWLLDSNPYMGRMRPLAAIAFIAVGMVFLFLPMAAGPRVHVIGLGLTLLVMFVGFLGVLGQLAGFSKIFYWYLGPVGTAGAGFILCSFGLLALLRHRSLDLPSWGSKDGEKITLVAGAIVVLTGLGGIFGGFAVLYPEAVKSLENTLALSLQGRSERLQNAIQQGWTDSYAYGNQPLRLQAMARLNRNPGDVQAKAQLQSVVANAKAFGFSAAVFVDGVGREVVRSGAFVTGAELAVTIKTSSLSRLLWKQGFILHTHIDMIENGQAIGSFEAERILAVGSELYDIGHFGQTLDFALCTKVGINLDCFPMRSNGGKVLRNAPTQVRGVPVPMTYALAGRSGVIQTTDYRGVPVIAAYAPFGTLGLGAVLKEDAAELYQPIAQRLGPLLVMLVLVSGMAGGLLRLQVFPLVRKLTREIYERQHAEARLQESEMHLLEITGSLGEGVYVLDAQGRVTFVNPEAERLLGWSAAELLGQEGHAAFHFKRPDGTAVPAADCPMHRTMSTGQIFRSPEEWFVRKDGSYLPVSLVSCPIVRHGEVTGSVASFEDISARLSAEEALRKSEQRFRTTLENAPIGMVISGLDGRFLQANQAMCHMLGYTKAEFEALNVDAITYPADREETRSLRQRMLDGEFDVYQQTKRYLGKEGQTLWIHLTASIVRDADETPRYFIGQVEDISQRRENEELLRESEERFRLISTVASDGIVTLGPAGEVIYWNPAAEKIFGYSAAEAVGQSFHELAAPARYRPDFQRGFAHFSVSGEGVLLGKPIEITGQRKNGEEFPVELSISALRMKDQWYAMGIVRDIGERKRTEEQIRHLAYYDVLTDLPNRRLFLDRLNQGLVQAKRYQRCLAVLYLDLDGFKHINDTLGHDVGDALLVVVAERLRTCIRSGDTVSRQGGDEFAMVLVEISRAQDAALVAQKVLDSLMLPIVVAGSELHVTASIGIALYPVDGTDDAQALMKKADIAMYDAKAAGRNRYVCNPAIVDRV